MKPKTMILMIVAVVCGLGASYMTSRLLAEREDQPEKIVVRESPKVKLLVAKKGWHTSALLKKPQDMFVEKLVNQEDAPKDAIRDWKALEGKTLRHALRVGDHVMPDDLRDGPATLDVPPGMRAVGLRVTVEAIAAGFASLPGSKVDIIWNMRGNGPDQIFSMKLLQNVLVLAADTQDGTPEGRALPASVVTLALTPRDTERVSLASENGTLRLVLRQPSDDTVSNDEPTTLSSLTRKDKDAAPEVEPIVPPVEEPKVADSKWELLPAPQRRQHVVWYREGGKQWKDVIELEDNDVPVDVGEPPLRPQATAAEPESAVLAAPERRNGQGKGG